MPDDTKKVATITMQFDDELLDSYRDACGIVPVVRIHRQLMRDFINMTPEERYGVIQRAASDTE